MVGVVQHQHVEPVGSAALEASLGGHAQVGGIALGPPEGGVGEARIALRAGALALVEVVSDHAHQPVALAPAIGQRLTDGRVGGAGAVDVGRDHGADVVPGAQQGDQALVLHRESEVHVHPAAPRAEGGMAEVGHQVRLARSRSGGGRVRLRVVAPVAQGIEQRFPKPRVACSSHAGGTAPPPPIIAGMPIAYEWRGAFENPELNLLHAEGFDRSSGTAWAGSAPAMATPSSDLSTLPGTVRSMPSCWTRSSRPESGVTESAGSWWRSPSIGPVRPAATGCTWTSRMI